MIHQAMNGAAIIAVKAGAIGAKGEVIGDGLIIHSGKDIALNFIMQDFAICKS